MTELPFYYVCFKSLNLEDAPDAQKPHVCLTIRFCKLFVYIKV